MLWRIWSHSDSASSCGSAAMRARLIVCAPWLPPITSSVRLRGLRPNCAARCGERRRGRFSRTGLPVTCTRSGYAKNDSIPGHGA